MKLHPTLVTSLALLLAIFVSGCGQKTASNQPQAPLAAEILEKLPAARKGQVLIYGAYGFTGRGISNLAAEYGITPVLSGRNEEKLKALAEPLGYDYITLSLDNNHDNLVSVLERFELVAHIAGPYTYTSKPMIDAAIEAGTHYIDLTGENHVIQAQLDRSAEFEAANIMVMPAVGYDVVPTDSLNLYVAQQLPGATRLTVLMDANYTQTEGAGGSRGTMKSGLEILSRPLLTRKDGQMIPMGSPKVIQRTENSQEQTLVQIPWADIVTSYVSTEIPTIEVFQVQSGSLPGWVIDLAQIDLGRRFLAWLIDVSMPDGPPPEAQAQRQTQIVSTASDDAGNSVSAEMITPEAYLLTFHSTLIVAKYILDGSWEAGFRTPAQMYGADLALEVPGVSRRDLPAD